MKRVWALMLTLMMAVMVSTSSASRNNIVETDLSGTGVKIELPGDYSDMEGTLQVQNYGVVSNTPLICCAEFLYSAMSVEEQDRILQAYQSEAGASEQDIRTYQESWMDVGMVLAADMTLEQLCSEIGFTGWDVEKTFKAAEVGNMKFYYVAFPEDQNHGGYAEFAANTEQKYLDEVDAIDRDLRAAVRSGQFFLPVNPLEQTKGMTLSFESADLDGNTVTSGELFRNNRFTMVNVWGTWCGNCLEEMAELAEIHRELQEKGCGVVGIENEMVWNDTIKEHAREILKEYGIGYPNVIKPEANEVLDRVKGYPCTFFVDSEGTILTVPISGASVPAYRAAIESLLKIGEVSLFADSTVTEGIYRVIVTDDLGPVPEVTIQFCDDTSCAFKETDENGEVSFERPAGVYEVHILEVPDGYLEDETIYYSDPTPGEIRIQIVRED